MILFLGMESGLVKLKAIIKVIMEHNAGRKA